MKHSRISIFALGTLLLQIAAPVALAAGSSNCSVSALNTVAGLGTQVQIEHCESNSSMSVSVRGPTGQIYTQTVATDAAGSATTLVPSTYTLTAGAYTVSAGAFSGTFTVTADRASDANSTINVSKQTIKADGQDTATVTVILRDKFDNAVAGRPIALIASRPGDKVKAQSNQTDSQGRFLWSVTSTENGLMTLIPFDVVSGAQMTMRGSVQVGSTSYLAASLTGNESGGEAGDVTSGLVDHFEISLPQNVKEVKANDLFTVTIRAMRGTELVPGYTGTLEVTSSDADAVLPKKGSDPNSPTSGFVDMRAVDQGVRKLPLAFVLRSGGAQIITVKDKFNSGVSGQISLTVTGGDTTTQTGDIQILSPKDGDHVKGPTVLFQGRAPSFINLQLQGGLTTVEGESDADGVFRMEVTLNPDHKEDTFFVTSDGGRKSQPLHLVIDTDGPKIDTIDLADGKTGEPSAITVKTEAGLASVTATVNDVVSTLTWTGSEMTLYRGTIVAPKTEGTYDVTVTATDSVGNASTMLTKWDVKTKDVATVEGVTAESQPMSVKLSWKALDAAASYKIYIAADSDPEVLLYSVSTGKPVTTAVVNDLPPGKYQFSLTAINKDGLESSEKSVPATASSLGLMIKATPGKDSVLLEWTPVADLPLSQYMLEYGVDGMSEQRTVNGQAVSAMVHDLLPNVTYNFRITPVTVTGKTMTELAATVSATPNGQGFYIGVGDPVPPDLLHSGAPIITPPPVNTGSGIPYGFVGALIGAIALFALYWNHTQKKRKAAAQFLETMQQRYHS